MHLYLIRHPAPQVAPGLCYGRSNLMVTQAAIDSALARCLPDLADFEREIGQKFAYFVSPLTRCTQFAAQLWQVRPFGRAIFDPRLMEMDFSAWEMQAWDQIPRQEIDAWALDPVHYRPGGGESVWQMACRVLSFYQQMQASSQPAVVICHAGTIRLLLACQLHASQEQGDPHQLARQIALHASKTSMTIEYGRVLTLPLALPAPASAGSGQGGLICAPGSPGVDGATTPSAAPWAGYSDNRG